jgi:hypothetical protein
VLWHGAFGALPLNLVVIALARPLGVEDQLRRCSYLGLRLEQGCAARAWVPQDAQRVDPRVRL